MTTEPWAIGIVLFAQIIGAFGAVYLKKGSGNFHIKTIFANINFIIGVFCYGLATLLFIPALKYGELSVLYPLVSTVYIWVALISRIMLGEKLNMTKILGIGCIVIGVILIGIGS